MTGCDLYCEHQYLHAYWVVLDHQIMAITLVAASAVIYYRLRPGKHVYLVDCFRPPSRMRDWHDMLIDGATRLRVRFLSQTS